VGPESEPNNLGYQGSSIWKCHLEQGNVSFNMCYCMQKNKVIILLETNNKCRIDQCSTSKEYKNKNPNYKKEIEPAQEN